MMTWTRHLVRSLTLVGFLVAGPWSIGLRSIEAASPATHGWSVVPSPNLGTDDSLSAVAAISPTNVWAVGNTSIPGSGNTLIEHFNGSTWTVVPSPNPGTSDYLIGVAASGPRDVWAVGITYAAATGINTLIEHFDGSVWTDVPSPNPATYYNTLNGVAALSPTNVWAVGYYQSSTNTNDTLIEHFNGSVWSIVPSPNPSATFNDLQGVTAISPTNVWAVGSLDPATGSALIEHFNGSTWSVVPNPNVNGSITVLNGVAALAPTDIWAVGNYIVAGLWTTLTEHFNGSAWNVVPSPNPAGTDNFLQGVAVLPPTKVLHTNVWAVGRSGLNSLIEHYSGSTWTVVPGPNPGTFSNDLNGVAGLSSTNVWAVGGTTTNYPVSNTLIEHFQ